MNDIIDSAYQAEIEAFLRDAFEENYELLRLEGGALAPSAKEAAFQQILLYWRKLRRVAEQVTDTEVKLTLPNQSSPSDRPFTIQGVVDIVEEGGRTVMYDIKTHRADYVRINREQYEQQLNIYAHIWQELRDEPLDNMAVIATHYPDGVKDALASGNPTALAYELDRWDPVVPIDFEPSRLEATIQNFGCVVDDIEEGDFSPREATVLQEQMPNSRRLFATEICVECDARFSCTSFREYATAGRTYQDRQFMRFYNDHGRDADQEEWRTAGLGSAPDLDTLETELT